MGLDIALLVGRMAVAAVFAAAGTAKMWDRAAFRVAIAAFGVPDALTGAAALALPPAELTIAALLIPARSAFWAATAALVLLAVFSAVIAFNLTRGRKPDCHCFGQIRSKPIGWPTLARNLVFACCAGLIVWQGPRHSNISAVAWLGRAMQTGPLTVVASSACALLVVETFLLFQLFLQSGRLMVRMDGLEQRLTGGAPPRSEGLPVGTPAPRVALSTLSGGATSLESLHDRARNIFLIFSHPECHACVDLLADVGRWQREYRDAARIVVINGGTEQAARDTARQYGLDDVLVQNGTDVSNTFNVHATPAAVVIRADGTIGSPIALGRAEITNLLAERHALASA